ncbi:MAG TPA: hypothetical protein VIY86_13330, partial [Pirellulaceae bacterium]
MLLEDLAWLVGEGGAAWLSRWDPDEVTAPSVLTALRRELSPARASLVVEQVVLRARAKRKFSDADRMFFDRVALEQATDEGLAHYKAASLATESAVRVADLCCGIG